MMFWALISCLLVMLIIVAVLLFMAKAAEDIMNSRAPENRE